MSASRRPSTLVFTQGDPAGVGPELLLRLLANERGDGAPSFEAIVIAERAVLERYAALVAGLERLAAFSMRGGLLGGFP